MGKVKSPLINLEGQDGQTGRKQEKSVQRERLSEGNQMYCVYWIRLAEHSDVSTQGYVGITKNLKERIRGHKKNRRKTVLTSAAKKYSWDNLIVEVIYSELSLQEALSTEETLRPDQRIGWNCQRGGELGVESSWYDIDSNRQKHSEATSKATKEGIKAKDSKEARSYRAKKSWEENKDSYKGMSKGSNNPRALLNEQQVKVIKYELLGNVPVQEIADMFGVKKHVINFIKYGKNWSHI